MRWVLTLLIGIFWLTGCASYHKLIRKGHYDRAIKVLVRKIQRGRYDAEELKALRFAFQRAQERDQQQLEFLPTTNVQSLKERLQILEQIRERQQLVLSVLPVSAGSITLRADNMPFIRDIDQQIRQTKEQLVTLMMQQARELLQGDYRDARRAYELLSELARYNREVHIYKTEAIERLREEARAKGTLTIPVTIRGTALPEPVADYIMDPSFWEPVHLPWARLKVVKSYSSAQQYFRRFVIRIDGVDVSPERLSESHETYRKEVVVDYDTIITRRGDTVVVPIKERYTARVTKLVQVKEAVITGQFIIEQGRESPQVVVSEPFVARAVFENVGYIIRGHREAVPAEIAEHEIPGPVPFPSDIDLLMQAGDNVRNAARAFVQKHRHRLSE